MTKDDLISIVEHYVPMKQDRDSVLSAVWDYSEALIEQSRLLNEVPSPDAEKKYEAYCPKCEVYLCWQQVTNDEKHCLCDTDVEWHPVGQ